MIRTASLLITSLLFPLLLASCEKNLSDGKIKELSYSFAIEEANAYVKNLHTLGAIREISKLELENIESQIRNIKLKVLKVEKKITEETELFTVKMLAVGRVTEKISNVQKTHNLDGIYIFNVKSKLLGFEIDKSSIIKTF